MTIKNIISAAVIPAVSGKKYTGVIFDFDGVIADTEKYHYLSWREAFSVFGVDITEEEYYPLRSTGRAATINAVSRNHGLVFSPEETARISEIKGESYNRYVEGLTDADLLPGIREYLDFLLGTNVKLGIASSSKFVREELSLFRLDACFACDSVIDGNCDIRKKPAPDIYLEAAGRLGISPSEGLVFEDSLVGVEAGLAAGFDVVKVGGAQDPRTLATVTDFRSLMR